jgi:hypothetical integral membrane protein (TIGR02206 family)
MNNYFFTEYTHMPAGVPGFGMFSAEHFAVLGIIAVIGVIFTLYYKKQNEKKRDFILKTASSICVLSEIARQAVTIATNQYNTGNIPVSMCNFSAYFLCFYAFTHIRGVGEFAYAIGLPGAALALISPGWANLPLANFFSIYSFFMHGSIVIMVAALLISGDLVPNPRKLGFTVIFIAVTAPIMHKLNGIWNTNIYFLEIPASGSPLMFISDIFGRFYILGFILFVLIIWTVMYIPWVIAGKRWKQFK